MEIKIGEEIYGKKKYYELLSNNPNELDRIYFDTNKEIIIRLKNFFQALLRQFTFGNFSKESKIYRGILVKFETL
jgi:hypothetical protein